MSIYGNVCLSKVVILEMSLYVTPSLLVTFRPCTPPILPGPDTEAYHAPVHPRLEPLS
jgi:hypothetical protein